MRIKGDDDTWEQSGTGEAGGMQGCGKKDGSWGTNSSCSHWDIKRNVSYFPAPLIFVMTEKRHCY